MKEVSSLAIFSSLCGADSYGCVLANTVANWLIFALLFSTGGYLVVFPISIGNNPYRVHPWRQLLAIGTTLLWTVYVVDGMNR